MKIANIESRRKFDTTPWFQIAFEWEDIFSNAIGLKIRTRSKLGFYLRQAFPMFFKGKSLIIDMTPYFRFKFPLLKAKKQFVPYIIDYFCRHQILHKVVNAYKKSPFVLISSRQVYDYLKTEAPELTVEHLALSIPDSQAKVSQKRFEDKKYDVVLAGRLSPVLKEYLDRYRAENPQLKVVEREKEGLRSFFKLNGELVCTPDKREDYLDLISESKILLYATSGYDGEHNAHGFYCVTPRFMEGLGGGCNMVLRYADNSDTRYYELEKFGPSAETYEIFKEQMDKALTEAPDLNFYSEFLKKHSTSERAKDLKAILAKYE